MKGSYIRMQVLSYIIAALVIFWAGFCLARHIRKIKKGIGCEDCSRCRGGCESCKSRNPSKSGENPFSDN